MNTIFRRLISGVLVLALMLTALAGCGKGKDVEYVEVPDAASAMSVDYSKSGKYKTTITPSSDEIDLSGITADKISISCYPPSDEAPVIERLTANGDGWDVVFTDKSAVDNVTSSYVFTFEDIGQASLAVNFPEMSLASDIESVAASADVTDITLTLSGGRFERGLSKSDLLLANAFEKMTVDSLSAAGNELTLRLKGVPAKNDTVNAYLFGSIGIKPSGIEDGYKVVTAMIDIARQYVGIDSSSLKFADGKITADLIAYGSVNVDELTKDNVTIDGFVTEDVRLKDGHTAVLSLSAKNIGSVNDFAEFAAGKDMNLNGYETTLAVSQASVSGMFDYCEEKGSDLEITLLLNASNGAFAKELLADMFTFGGDFEGAAAETVKRISDTAAEIIISLPANGVKAEDIALSGTVALAGGTLVNMWNEDASSRLTVIRASYAEELDRNIPDTIYTISNTIKGLIKDKESLFGRIFTYSTYGAAALKYGWQILEMLGVFDDGPSEESQQFMQLLDELHNIEKTLNEQTLMLERIEASENKRDFADYNSDFRDMISALEGMKALYKNARDDYAPKVAIVGEPLPKSMQDEGIEPEKWLDWDSADENERVAYLEALTDTIIMGNLSPTNTRYINYKMYNEDLNRSFRRVTGYLMGTEKEFLDKDPLDAFDEYCTKRYNFDTQAIGPRLSYRIVAEEKLIEVMGMLQTMYKTGSNPNNHDFMMLNGRFEAAVNNIEAKTPVGLLPSEVRCYPHYTTVDQEITTFISEIKLAGYSNDIGEGILKDEGYTVIKQDLNNNAGGHYIYLGYKTTTDYNDAIKDIVIREGKGNNTDTFDLNGLTYYLSAFTGDEEFTRNRGDMNEEAGGSDLFLYYTKQDTSENTAVYEIYLDSSKNGAASGIDLNKGAGGDDIYLHLNKVVLGGTKPVQVLVGNDPAYFPFCYSLGRKVSLITSKEYSYHNEAHDDWQEVEINRFMQRASYTTVQEELRSAGILRDEYTELSGMPFAVTVKSDYVTLTGWEKDNRSGRKSDSTEYHWGEWRVKADGFYLNSYSLSNNIDIATIIDPKKNPKHYKDVVSSEFFTFKFS